MESTYTQKKMKFFLTISLLCLTNLAVAQVGINTVTPEAGSILDIASTNKGLLVPRVSISNLNTISPITGGSTESLLVYNTNTTTGKGFHYWTGAVWQPMESDWTTKGNSGTSTATHFIGTTDDVDMVFKTDDNEAMRITSSAGQLLIGKTIPGSSSDLLQVVSDIEIGGGSSNYDYDSENIQMTARSNEWNINVKNDSQADETTFYIGTSENENSAVIMLSPDGDVKLGKNSDDLPEAELHVVNDQDDKTVIMIDNTNSGTDTVHTALELWDGTTFEKAFFRHNNNTDVLQIGHSESDGKVEFFSGDGSGSNSDVAMTLEDDLTVTIESLMNLKPRSAPSSPNEGDIYYDSTSKKVRVYTGSAWSNLN